MKMNSSSNILAHKKTLNLASLLTQQSTSQLNRSRAGKGGSKLGTKIRTNQTTPLQPKTSNSYNPSPQTIRVSQSINRFCDSDAPLTTTNKARHSYCQSQVRLNKKSSNLEGTKGSQKHRQGSSSIPLHAARVPSSFIQFSRDSLSASLIRPEETEKFYVNSLETCPVNKVQNTSVNHLSISDQQFEAIQDLTRNIKELNQRLKENEELASEKIENIKLKSMLQNLEDLVEKKNPVEKSMIQAECSRGCLIC